MDIINKFSSFRKVISLGFILWIFLGEVSVFGGVFNSTQSGNFSSAATWGNTGNTANTSYPTLTYWAKETVNINNGHVVTLGSDAWGGSAATQTMIIKNGGTLNINGNLNVNTKVTILVEAGGTLNITGKYNAKSSRISFTSLGNLNINGAVDLGSNPNI